MKGEQTIMADKVLDALTLRDTKSGTTTEYKIQDSVLKARVDSLTKLGEGSTTGDAELQDIRVDYKGTTHENAGDAVRASDQALDNKIDDEVSKLKGEINNVILDLQETQNILKTVDITNQFSWRTGKITDLGEQSSLSSAIRTSDSFVIAPYCYIIPAKNMELKVIKYDLNRKYIGVVYKGQSAYKITENARYKISLENLLLTDISPDNVLEFVSIKRVEENNFHFDIETNVVSIDKIWEQINNLVKIASKNNINGKTYEITRPQKYNAWPFLAVLGGKILCIYSQGTNHVDNVSPDVYMSLSDNGIIWKPEKKVVATENVRDTVTGIGNDEDGNVIFWNRVGSPSYPDKFELYKTLDGISCTKISELNFENDISHIGDMVNIPTLGIFTFWNTYRHNNSMYGYMVSNDNGLTWKRTTIGSYTTWDDCPTEFSTAYVGNGKIIAMARSEKSLPMFQITSSDYGQTWSSLKQTNIDDVVVSTPSLVFDSKLDKLNIYYYNRGNGQLKVRTSSINDIFQNPTNWSEAITIANGKTGNDAGNVNAVHFGDNDIVAFYSGDEENTGVYSVIN